MRSRKALASKASGPNTPLPDQSPVAKSSNATAGARAVQLSEKAKGALVQSCYTIGVQFNLVVHTLFETKPSFGKEIIWGPDCGTDLVATQVFQ